MKITTPFLLTKDNGSNGQSTEQDPIAFTYLPFGQQDAVGNLIPMGKVNGNGSFTAVNDGISTTTLVQGGAMITTSIDGLYTLTIPGQDPTKGVLMVSPEGAPDAATADLASPLRDNFVTYEPNQTGGWTIAVRDIGLRQPQLESVGALPSFSFAFIPFENAPTGPTYGALVGGVVSVPEPSTLVLLVIPFGLALWSRARRA